MSAGGGGNNNDGGGWPFSPLETLIIFVIAFCFIGTLIFSVK